MMIVTKSQIDEDRDKDRDDDWHGPNGLVPASSPADLAMVGCSPG